MTNPVAEKLGVAVRRILDPRERRPPQLRLESGPVELDERADDPATHRRDPGEPSHARAFEEAHQHGLRLIVGVVTERDPMGAEASGACLQRRVPRRPRRGLERAPRIDRHGRDVDRNAEAGPERLDEVGVAGRIGAQLVIDVKDVELESPLRCEPGEKVQQRHRVGAARHCDQDGFAAREHRVAANGTLHLLARGHPPTRPGDPPRPRRPRSAPSSRPGRCA